MAKHALVGIDGVGTRKEFFLFDPRQIKIVDGWNPRTDFDTDDDKILKESIIENGVLQPLRVKRSGDEIHLIDGERRLRAVLQAIADGCNIEFVPMILERKTISDVEAMLTAIIANDGKPFEPIEEAAALARLVKWGVTVDELAKRLGRCKVFVYERLKLVDASPELRSALKNKDVSIKTAAKIVATAGGDTERQVQGIARARDERKITISWDKQACGAKIKAPGRPDDFCQLGDVFKPDFLIELKELGADLRTLRVVFKKV